VDVSIRPGWFYHAKEDEKAKSAKELVDIYYDSVGRGASLLLNLPPDRRGLIPERDAAHLQEMRRILAAAFKKDLASYAKATASGARGAGFGAENVNDGKPATCWALPDGQTSGSLELAFKKPTRFDQVLLQEYIPLGQRVEAWTLEGQTQGQWQPVTKGTTIGYKRMVRFAPVVADRVRLTIDQARACPAISTFSLYLASAPE
jgi:alpha-L-fucosidase